MSKLNEVVKFEKHAGNCWRVWAPDGLQKSFKERIDGVTSVQGKGADGCYFVYFDPRYDEKSIKADIVYLSGMQYAEHGDTGEDYLEVMERNFGELKRLVDEKIANLESENEILELKLEDREEDIKVLKAELAEANRKATCWKNEYYDLADLILY